jgi:hypothetical protein
LKNSCTSFNSKRLVDYQCTNLSTHVGNPKMLGSIKIENLKMSKILPTLVELETSQRSKNSSCSTPSSNSTLNYFVNSNLALNAPSR